MIVIYPMLTSASVSPNVLPGIVKAMEKYMLLYNTDEVLRAVAGSSAGRILSTGVGTIATAVTAAAATAAATVALKKMGLGEDSKFMPNLIEAPISFSKTSSVKPDRKTNKLQQSTNKSVSIAPEVQKTEIRSSLDLPKSDAVSLEPTWMTVTTQKKGAQILGVKVVPFQVKTGGVSMANLLIQDKQLKDLEFLATKYGRAITRVFFRIMRKIKLPIIADRAISGDPKQDIIFGGSQYGKNMFFCLSQLDLENEDIFSTPGGVQKLHKLGWASFAVIDDVNRKATFCMKEFGGVCSVVPYSFIFSSLGKEHSKVYEDLEDLKKTSGPFFNMRTNRKRTFGENYVKPIDKYLNKIQE